MPTTDLPLLWDKGYSGTVLEIGKITFQLV